MPMTAKPPYPKTLHDEIRLLRLATAKTQSAAADELNISRQTMQKYETGKQNPRPTKLYELVSGLMKMSNPNAREWDYRDKFRYLLYRYYINN